MRWRAIKSEGRAWRFGSVVVGAAISGGHPDLQSPYAEKKNAYTTTTERKSFGELFWPKRKTSQASGGYKNPITNQENHIYHRNHSSVAPIVFGKEKFFTGAGRCMLSFPQLMQSRKKNPKKMQCNFFWADLQGEGLGLFLTLGVF